MRNINMYRIIYYKNWEREKNQNLDKTWRKKGDNEDEVWMLNFYLNRMLHLPWIFHFLCGKSDNAFVRCLVIAFFDM